MSVPHIGQPMMKARVPSIGSTTQRSRASGRVDPCSSPTKPCSGQRSATAWAITCSAALVGLGNGVEGARAGLVGDVERLTKVGPYGCAGRIGRDMREIYEVAQGRLRLICHSITLAGRKTSPNNGGLIFGHKSVSCSVHVSLMWPALNMCCRVAT